MCVLQLLNAALSSAHEDDITFREGLPLSYLDYTGMVNLDSVSWKGSCFIWVWHMGLGVSELHRAVPLWTWSCAHTHTHYKLVHQE